VFPASCTPSRWPRDTRPRPTTPSESWPAGPAQARTHPAADSQPIAVPSVVTKNVHPFCQDPISSAYPGRTGARLVSRKRSPTYCLCFLATRTQGDPLIRQTRPARLTPQIWPICALTRCLRGCSAAANIRRSGPSPPRSTSLSVVSSAPRAARTPLLGVLVSIPWRVAVRPDWMIGVLPLRVPAREQSSRAAGAPGRGKRAHIAPVWECGGRSHRVALGVISLRPGGEEGGGEHAGEPVPVARGCPSSLDDEQVP
jgi:hypothetical protein